MAQEEVMMRQDASGAGEGGDGANATSIQAAIARLEKQYEEDKQTALEKQRKEYERWEHNWWSIPSDGCVLYITSISSMIVLLKENMEYIIFNEINKTYLIPISFLSPRAIASQYRCRFGA